MTLSKANAYRCVDALSCRACPLRHLRRHLSQRERLWQAAVFPVSFWRNVWYNGFAVHPAYLTGEEVDALAYFLTFLVSVGADVVSHFICKWLDRYEENRKA